MNLSRREFLKSSLAAAAGMGALGLLGACSTQENTTTTLAPGASCLMEMSFELNTKDEIVKFSVAPPYVRGNVSKEFDPELLLL